MSTNPAGSEVPSPRMLAASAAVPGNGRILADVARGNPLVKYAYANDGGSNFLRLIGSETYRIFRDEIDMIREDRPSIAGLLRSRVVVLGTGEGSKLVGLVSEAKPLTLIDISASFLDAAARKLARPVDRVNACIEEVDFSRFGGDTTFLMFGGTLGNIADWPGFLARLGHECADSNAIIGMEFSDPDDEPDVEILLEAYRCREALDFVFHPLALMGVSPDEGVVEVSFNPVRRRVEYHFRLRGKSQGILLAVSNKPSYADFCEAVAGAGMTVGRTVSRRGNIALVEVNWR